MTTQTQPRMTDEQREKLEALLLVAFGLLYRAGLARAYTQLSVDTVPAIADDAQAWLQNAAKQRAQDAQNGINTRIDTALDKARLSAETNALSEGDAADAMLVRLRQDMETYNHIKLVPNMASQIAHQAQHDAYANIIVNGAPAIQSTQWIWSQYSSNPDDCADAAAASPATYNDLIDIAGSAPPRHANCSCRLDPA